MNFGLEEGVANAAKFGPLAKFGDDDLSLTLNAIFEKTFGKYRTPGTGLDYAAQFKFAVVDGISAGAELFGDISDLGDVPSFNDTEFRVGPVLYLSWRSDQSHVGFTGDIGVLLGTTDADAGHDDQMGPRADLLIRKVFPSNRRHGSELPRAGSHCCDDPLLGTQIHWQNDRRLEA